MGTQQDTSYSKSPDKLDLAVSGLFAYLSCHPPSIHSPNRRVLVRFIFP